MADVEHGAAGLLLVCGRGGGRGGGGRCVEGFAVLDGSVADDVGAGPGGVGGAGDEVVFEEGGGEGEGGVGGAEVAEDRGTFRGGEEGEGVGGVGGLGPCFCGGVGGGEGGGWRWRWEGEGGVEA